MKTEQINLTSTYTYIRCDSEFELLFTNGQKMPMWRGFYCFRTEQLQEYNTNGQLIIQSNDDNCHMWWLCTNTLIMSVTDINNEALNGIGQLVSGISEITYNNALANLNQLTYGDRTNNLLESIQNSFSIFLNAYVEANNVQDFGYITGTINNEFNCDVYIAKANKYHFNCGITFSHNFNTGYRRFTQNNAPFALITLDNSKLFNISCSLTDVNRLYLNFTLSLKRNAVNFSLYNNLNEYLSGYSVSNPSVTSRFYLPSGYYVSYYFSSGRYVGYDGITLDNSISASFSNNVFGLSMSSASYDKQGTSMTFSNQSKGSESLPSLQCSETMTINFDVSKT